MKTADPNPEISNLSISPEKVLPLTVDEQVDMAIPPNRFKRHHPALAVVISLIAPFSVVDPAGARSTQNLHVGGAWEFQFQGNPSTGYRWQLDAPRSKGLDVVSLASLGYVGGGARAGWVGAPAPFKFRVTCLKAGLAQLAFEYVGPTGKRSQKRDDVSVRCD
jgi:predicted secreted protein